MSAGKAGFNSQPELNKTKALEHKEESAEAPEQSQGAQVFLFLSTVIAHEDCRKRGSGGSESPAAAPGPAGTHLQPPGSKYR